MGSLTKSQLIGTDKRRRHVEKVPLPDAALNGNDHVYVRKLSAGEALAMASAEGPEPSSKSSNRWTVGTPSYIFCKL